MSFEPAAELVDVGLRPCVTDENLKAYVEQVKEISHETIEEVNLAYAGVTEECRSMKRFVDQHDSKPDGNDILDEVRNVVTKVREAKTELGSAAGKILDSTSRIDSDFHKRFDVMEGRLVGIKEQLVNLSSKVEQVLNNPRSSSIIRTGNVVECDLDEIISRFDSLLSKSDLKSFFSWEGCSNNELFCLPFLLLVPTVVGMFVGMLVAIRCYCYRNNAGNVTAPTVAATVRP